MKRWAHNTAATAVSIAAVLSLAASPSTRAQDSTNSTTLFSDTIAQMPSCISYEVRGVCFWLYCTLFSCKVRTSLKVRHYVPDVIVSTYNDIGSHPWSDIAKPLSESLGAVGAIMAGIPLQDASANNARHRKEDISYKSADAIGNPMGMIGLLLAGESEVDTPANFQIPGFNELMKFPVEEMPRILSEWATVPAQTGNELIDAARRAAQAPQSMLDQLTAFPGSVSGKNTPLGPVGDVVGGKVSGKSMGVPVDDITGIDTGPMKEVGMIIEAAGGGNGESAVVCPGSASLLSLHFLSDLDTPFWRAFLPIETLYAGTWVPGINEVSTENGLVSTWGGQYPRQGDLVQQHPVKASAVVAERVASIIRRHAQPHIYAPLHPAGKVKYFETQGERKWSMLFPVKSSGCMKFGENDSLWIKSFGDKQTSATHGYVWSLWQRYECCGRAGQTYLYSVP